MNFQLDNAKRSAFEIEEISNNVMRNMDEQTNQLKNIKQKSIQLDENLDQGDFYINSMYKQERRKKLVMIILGVFLLLIFLMIVITRFV